MDDDYVPDKSKSKNKHKGKGKGKRRASSGELPCYVSGSKAHVIQLDTEDENEDEDEDFPDDDEQLAGKKKRRSRKKAKHGEMSLLILGRDPLTRSATDSRDVDAPGDEDLFDQASVDLEGRYPLYRINLT